MDIVAYTPARLGSERVRRKNLRSLAAPFLKTSTIDLVQATLLDKGAEATVFTTTRLYRHLILDGLPMNFDPRAKSPRTQDLKPFEYINFIAFAIARAIRIRAQGRKRADANSRTTRDAPARRTEAERHRGMFRRRPIMQATKPRGPLAARLAEQIGSVSLGVCTDPRGPGTCRWSRCRCV